VGQSAIANHLLDVVDLVLTRTSLLAVSQNDAENLVALARSMRGEGADQMRDCVVESGPASRLVLSLAERRDLTERDPVMDCRNPVVEQGQRESGVDRDLLLLLDQLVETPYSDAGQMIHGTRAVGRNAIRFWRWVAWRARSGFCRRTAPLPLSAAGNDWYVGGMGLGFF
jgi:hypothetical protein